MDHSNSKAIREQKKKEAMVAELIDATWDSGYYQAVMEKLSASLSDEDMKKYASLNQLAIARREELRKQVCNA